MWDHETVFYTQSVVRTPCFMMTEKYRVNRCLFLRCARRRKFLSKLRLFCLRTRLWISLALWEQLQGILTSKTMKWMTCWCTHSQTTAFCSHEKSCTFRRWRHDLHWILKALNTDFELCINNVFPTVHNKLLRHSKVCNISQHSKESTWTNIEMTSFSTEKIFWGEANIQKGKVDFPSITRLELRSVERKYRVARNFCRF